MTPHTFPPQKKPQHVAHVTYIGRDWALGYEVEHNDAPSGVVVGGRAECVITDVQLGGQWFSVLDVLSEDLCNALGDTLNAMSWNDEREAA